MSFSKNNWIFLNFDGFINLCQISKTLSKYKLLYPHNVDFPFLLSDLAGETEIELGTDEILADGILRKSSKDLNQLEVAIGEGMEFTIHGE